MFEIGPAENVYRDGRQDLPQLTMADVVVRVQDDLIGAGDTRVVSRNLDSPDVHRNNLRHNHGHAYAARGNMTWWMNREI